MLACELKREAPCAGRGNGLDFDGQGFEARANAGLLFRGDSPMTGCGEEHVAHFDRPQGRDERTPLDHRLAQPVGRFGRFVGEDPRHGKRAAERYRVDAGLCSFPGMEQGVSSSSPAASRGSTSSAIARRLNGPRAPVGTNVSALCNEHYEKPQHAPSFGLGFQHAALCIAGVVLTPVIVIQATGGGETCLSLMVFAALAVSGLTTIPPAVSWHGHRDNLRGGRCAGSMIHDPVVCRQSHRGHLRWSRNPASASASPCIHMARCPA